MPNSKIKAASGSPEIFSVWSDEVAHRFDPFFYRPEFKRLSERLKDIKAVPFGMIIDSISNGLDFREFEEEGITDYLRVGNIRPHEIDLSDVKKIPISIDEIQKDIRLRRDDLLLTRKGTYGVAVALRGQMDAIICSEIFLIRLNRLDVDPRYVEAFLNSDAGQKQFLQYKVGAIMGSLAQDAVKEILIPIPDAKTQKEIIEKIDAIYDEKKKIENEIESLLASIDDYVLGELGVKIERERVNGAPEVFVVWNDGVANERLDAEYYRPFFKRFYQSLSKGKYATATVESISTGIFQGVGKNETDNPSFTLLKVKNIRRNNEIDFEDVENVDEVPENKVLRSLDIISPFIGQAVRQCKFSVFDKNTGKYAVDNNTGVIRVDRTKAKSEYVATVLNSPIGQTQLEHLIGGGGVPFLGAANAKKIQIPLPPMKVQEAIAANIDKKRHLIRELREQIAKIVAEVRQQTTDMILA